VVICLERGAYLHMAQLMPLPLTVSCFKKIQIDFTFLVPAHPGSPGQRAVKRVCVCVIGQSSSSRNERISLNNAVCLAYVYTVGGLWRIRLNGCRSRYTRTMRASNSYTEQV